MSTLILKRKNTYGGVGSYVNNEQWSMAKFMVEDIVSTYSVQGKLVNYSEVKFTLHIQRKPLFYKFNLVFPCILLSFIGVLVFVLPVESGEKVSLSMTVLLSLTVFMLMVSESMPASSETVPFLGKNACR